MQSLAGHFLIASPYLSDGNFFRSVVLMVSHDEEHAFGLLLNRPGHHSLDEVWQRLTDRGCPQQVPVRTGGPLEGTLMAIHQDPHYSDILVLPEIHLTTKWETVVELVESGEEELIPVIGYSGWGPGQLEAELDAGGWMTLEATAEVVLADPDEQWQLAARHVGDEIMGGIPMRHAPKDTRWN